MSKDPPYGLVVPRPVLEIDRHRGVPELMSCDPYSRRFLDAHSNLFAEHQSRLRLTALTRKQPRGIRAAEQCRPELMNIFIDQISQRLIERKVQIDPVLHIIVREHKPVGRVQATGLDEVLAQLNADEIAKPDGRESEDRDRHSELRRIAALMGA